LGETGVLGFAAFMGMFLIYGIYVYRLLPSVTSRVNRNFVLGVTAGVFGVALNAILIDVFEASKVAYQMWMYMGLAMAVLYLVKDRTVPVAKDLKTVLLSIPAIFLYIVVGSIVVFWSPMANYFVGDDFTWLRWAADCKLIDPHLNGLCPSAPQIFTHYFTDATNFFYRPGTKIYFYLMYSLFWLNAILYHIASVLIHALIAFIIFLFGLRLFKSKLFAAITATLFLTMSASYEAIFWISVSGHLISAGLVLLSLLLFSYWQEQRKILLLALSLLSMALAPLFHEYAVVGPVLIVVFALLSSEEKIIPAAKKLWTYILPFFVIIPIYLYLRAAAHTVGLQGDYSYNLAKLPANMIGNAFGYVLLFVFGVNSLPFYQSLREGLKSQATLIGVVGLVAVVVLGYGVYAMRTRVSVRTQRLTLFGVLFFVISMAPFLGLGNLAERYIYFGLFGLVLLVVLMLRGIYVLVSKKNPVGAYLLLAILLTTIVAFNISQLQKLNKDWQVASGITNTTVNDFGIYAGENKDLQNPVYYFVNTPVKQGHAWVFPVGLPDALYFTAQNQNLTVHISNSLDEALQQAEGSKSARVFVFNKSGNLEIVTKSAVPNNE
jgi:hypothetical protein